MIEIIFILFLIAASVQTIYWLFFAVSILSHKLDRGVNAQNASAISIIICAYNDLENLKKLLPNLYQQEYSDYEIIVVNDKSNDGTYDFLLEESKVNPLLKMVDIDRTPDHINSKKYAITLGVKVAKYERLLFTDADCIPASDQWVKSMADSFEDKTHFALGYSQFKSEPGFVNTFSRYETQMTGMLYNSFAIAGNPYMGVGRNMAYNKSVFFENNGFNQFQKILGGDDDLFVNQYANGANTEVCLGKDALVWSYSKKTIPDYFKQKLRHISVSKYYNTKDKLLLGLYSLSHLLFWFAFIILAVANYFPEFVFGVLAIRLILNGLIVNSISKKFGERIVIWSLPIIDFVYSVYLLIMGFATLSTKKVTWS
ncbi:glycosyltransferase [Reichenbachiella sp. MALMAid0571]|uniref:glycosyltransferase n=1 Tax=Reichenbachiella sp. MALMAid0571 TaxID=3143939 RepID=UPI0032E006F4